MIKMAYYNEFIRCYSDGKIERLDKRYKNPVWREVTQTNFDDDGYLKITIDGKTEPWHKIIWIAFNCKIPDGLTINHKDEIKTNNSLDNLELLTHKENDNYGTRNERIARANTNGKLSKPIIGIHIKTGEKIEFPSTQEAGRDGFDQSAVCKCIKGKLNHHHGYKWYFKSDYERS